MKRKALRVRPEGSTPPYVTEAESRKQHGDSPLCNSLCKRLARERTYRLDVRKIISYDVMDGGELV